MGGLNESDYPFFILLHYPFEESKFKQMKLSSQILYIHLVKLSNRLADDDGWFFRDIPTLSQDTGLYIDTIKTAKKELVKNQYIDTKRGYFQENGHRSASFYKINGYKKMSQKGKIYPSPKG